MTNATRAPAAHTGPQVAAADPALSVWVSANAGTGKTHVLIERILRLLLAGTAPGKILVLTYTKAAATEAADRLSARLGAWAAATDADLGSDMRDLLGRPPTGAEAAGARTLFALSLEAPEGVRIRTIHSFCESLLGRFPVEAGVAPHFSVIDERMAREIRADVENRLLAHEAHRPAAVTKAIAHIARLVDKDAFGGLIGEMDAKRGRLRHLLADGIAPVMQRARAATGLKPKDTYESILAAATADAAFDRDGLMRAAKALSAGAKTDKGRAETIRAWLKLTAERRAEAFADEYALAFVTKTDRTPLARAMTNGAEAADPGAMEIITAEQGRVAAVFDRLRALFIIEATGALLTVGEALIADYVEAKEARACLDYDDLIERAAALLSDDKGVSWVHYKLDGGIDHILVDEAQDTGPASWQVIERLSGDFFSGLGAGERPLGRTVFAVGDEKQSIYSFQGAVPARFSEVGERYARKVRDAGGTFRNVDLELSYRSTVPVLGTVDRVFDEPGAADGLTWSSTEIRHDSNRAGQSGLVEVWPTLVPEEAEPAPPPEAPVDQMPPDSPAARAAARIAGSIERWIKDRVPLPSAGRPIGPGDILILVRTRGTFADEMVRALERRGVAVTGRDRLKLMDHMAVMDLVAVGRFALMPDDDLNTATVLKCPLIGFDDGTLFALAHDRKGEGLWHALSRRRDENKDFKAAHGFLSGVLDAADWMPPYEFFSGVLRSGGRRKMLKRLGSEAAEPIDEFLAQALAFERNHEPSLEGFLHWLESGDVEIKREMEKSRDRVRVMTVHGAKGLEAPIVILPDTCRVPNPGKDDALQWHKDTDGEDEFVLWRLRAEDEDALTRRLHAEWKRESMREYRRLLYVALTRARDRLYVGGWEGANRRPEGNWYDMVRPVVEETGADVALGGGNTGWRVERDQTDKPDGAEAAPEAAKKKRLPPWATRDPDPEPEPSQPLAPSAPSDDEEDPPVISPLGDDSGARFRRGILVHRLLQGLPDISPKARQRAAQAFLSRPRQGLDAGERDVITAETLAVMDAPAFAPLFGPGSLAEVPITGVIEGKDGSRVISGQVDRLVVEADQVTVVDYKTNRPPPERESDVDPRYLRQMAAYRAVIRMVYPAHRIKAVLLWTVGPRATMLSDAILDAHAP